MTSKEGKGIVSSGSSVMDGGYEVHTFFLAHRAFANIQAHAQRFEAPELKRKTVRARMAALYMFSPRPAQEDIGNISVAPLPDGFEVTLRIKRGHYVLMQFLQDHASHLSINTYVDNGILSVECHDCMEGIELQEDSLPQYDRTWLQGEEDATS